MKLQTILPLMIFFCLSFLFSNSLLIAGTLHKRVIIPPAGNVRTVPLVSKHAIPNIHPTSVFLNTITRPHNRITVQASAFKELPSPIIDQVSIKKDVWELFRELSALKSRIMENSKGESSQVISEKLEIYNSVSALLKKYVIYNNEYLQSFTKYRSFVVGRRAKYKNTEAAKEAFAKMLAAKAEMDKIMDMEIIKTPMLREAYDFTASPDAKIAGDLLVSQVKWDKMWGEVVNMANSLPENI